jgi:cobalt-zinc-cadmium efflux system protein
MLSDFLAIILALTAYRYESKPADSERSYGYGRMQIISSFINGVTLLLISIIIAVAACIRMFNPPKVDPDIMLLVAGLGTFINAITFFILEQCEEKNLSMRGAILHILGDLLGYIAAAIGALVIKYTNLHIIDPLLSILFSLLILNSSWRLTKASIHILLEGAPDGIKADKVKELLSEIVGVKTIEHIHLWLLTDNYIIVTLHLLLDEQADPFKASEEAQRILAEKTNIKHATIAVERYKGEVLEGNYSHHHVNRG